MSKQPTSTDLREYQHSGFYRKFLADGLISAVESVAKARAALEAAQRDQRVQAMIAHRAGMTKVAIGLGLGISRPTLDDWLTKTATDEDEMASVLSHEHFVAREIDPATAVHGTLGKARR